MPRESAGGRERILAAARELFAENGFDRTTTAALARRAEVPQGLIFYHFGTKADLLLTLVREHGGGTTAALLPDPVPADPEDAVARLWERLCLHLSATGTMHRIVRRELPHHAALREFAADFERGLEDRVTGYLAAVAGRADEAEPDRTAARLLILAAAVERPEGAEPVPPAAIARLLVPGLRRG